MSDDEAPKDVPPVPPPPPGGQYPPNWGSAYPPPPAGQYPPSYGSAHPPQGAPQPGYPQAAYGVVQPPAHQHATTSMVLGIVSLAGMCLCYITIFLAPVAWYLGAKAVKEIDANPGAFSGRSQANAGKIMGIIGTILMVLSLLAIVAVIAVAITDPTAFDESGNDYFIGGLF
jgi:hypothetical protein